MATTSAAGRPEEPLSPKELLPKAKTQKTEGELEEDKAGELVLPSHMCGNPGEILKGVLHGTRFNIGDKIRYSCLSGYILEGHAILTCIVSPGNGASWDFPAPFCRGKGKHPRGTLGPQGILLMHFK